MIPSVVDADPAVMPVVEVLGQAVVNVLTDVVIPHVVVSMVEAMVLEIVRLMVQCAVVADRAVMISQDGISTLMVMSQEGTSTGRRSQLVVRQPVMSLSPQMILSAEMVLRSLVMQSVASLPPMVVQELRSVVLSPAQG